MKKLMLLAVVAVMIISLAACGKDNSSSTVTDNQESTEADTNEEDITAQGDEDTNSETADTGVEGKYPSNYVKCNGDSDYLTPVTDDYAIGIKEGHSEPVTELICFDEEGNMVYDVRRTEYGDEEGAKSYADMYAESGDKVVTTKEEFVEGTYILSGKALYECITIDPEKRLKIGDCDKMRYFSDAMASDSEMQLWFSIPYLTQEQLTIENYCVDTDFPAVNYLEPATADYYLEGDKGEDYERTILVSFDENGKAVQLEEYYVYTDEATAMDNAGSDDYIHYGDGVVCYKHKQEDLQSDIYLKEYLYFNFERFKDKSEVDFDYGYDQKWFSIPSLTEAQSTTYQAGIAELAK